MKKFRALVVVFLFFLASCSKIDFVYKNEGSVVNPIYNNTNVSVSGLDVPIMNRYVSSYFGTPNNPQYNLKIHVTEKKIKTSVATDQSITKIRYELGYLYKLKSKKDCVSYEKKIVSTFTLTPKSSGFNFGSDRSLDNKYELAIIDSFNQFLSFISDKNFNNCNNES